MRKITLVFGLVFALLLSGAAVSRLVDRGETYQHALVSAGIDESGYTPFLEYAEHAYGSSRRTELREIFALYGDSPDFQEIMFLHGIKALLVVEKFYRDGSTIFEVQRQMNRVGDALVEFGKTLADGQLKTPKLEPLPELMPFDLGYAAILLIKESPDTMLGQFTVSQVGYAKRVYSDSVFRIGEDLLFGHLVSLERKYTAGKEITRGDVGAAAFEMALLVAGMKIKSILSHRSAQVAVAGTKAAKVGLAMRSFAGVARVAGGTVGKTALVLGTGYMIIKHPAVVDAGFGYVAETIGIHPLLGRAAGWAILLSFLLAPILVVWKLTSPLRVLCRACYTQVRRLSTSRSL